MDCQLSKTKDDLERMLYDHTAEPTALPLSLLTEITNGFSAKHQIGEGGFAVVYQGILKNGKVAVKRLSNKFMDDKEFLREVECLMMTKHKNVVRFLGYCADTQGSMELYNGKLVMADVKQRLLCFEYLSKGSLVPYITDASCGLEWRNRYKIIEGISLGLHYLHQKHILHLDLKPGNILLDDNYEPKIADFGLSRVFHENQSRAITKNIRGTLGYLPHEFFNGVITYKTDCFSLGVIVIELLTGKKGYHDADQVLESWSNRLEKSHRDIQREQVRVCTQIGMECIESNPAKRPVSMEHIIARLLEMGNAEGSIETVMTRSSPVQAKTDNDDPDHGSPKALGGTSSETSYVFALDNEVPPMVFSATWSDQLRRVSAPKGLGETSTETNSVSELVDEVPSMAVSAAASDQQRGISAPKRLGETNSEDFSFSGPSISVSDPMSEHMPVAVLIALRKIGFILGDEAARPIIAKLTEKVPNLKELPLKFEKIREQLTIFSDIIGQISTVYLTDRIVENWIWQVRNVAYYVEDVMDKYSYHVLQALKQGFLEKLLIKGTQYVNVFSKIVDEVVKVEKDILQVIEMKGQWLQSSRLVPNQLTEMERHRFNDSFPEFVKDEDLVGIEQHRKLLTGWLHSEETESTVITVCGMGGLGKSTLVSNVYEREKINFPANALIVVSEIYTTDSLLRKLLWKIGYTEQPLSAHIGKMDVHDLKKAIQKRLENKKCLIVLDDVWDQVAYFQIRDVFQNLQGSRILITTRNNHVAGISSPTRRLVLGPLSSSDAFDLFRRRAFYNKKDHMCSKEFEAIAMRIVDMCCGLPLAIVTIGSMLSSRQRLDFWKKTHNQLLSELSKHGHVRSILTMSYQDLPGDLRICFLYCSLFPEDYPMSRDMLVRLWVAEGFVVSVGNNTPEVVAEGILMELIHRNMLQLLESDELGRVNTCKMHDIVREMAIYVAKEEKFASANDYGSMIQIDKDVRRLSSYGWKDDTPLKVELPRLRTVVSLGIMSCSRDMLPSILSGSHCLTVLELQDSEVTELPTLIGSLFNLRYIGLRRTKVKSLPDSIENLSNLQTLDIKQTEVEKLPQGIVKIKKLRHIIADRYADEKQSEFRYFIGMEAPKELSNLEELQTLETVKSSNDLAEQLRKLMQLRSLWIDNISAADCANLFATLSTMPLLSSLLLSARDENEALCFESLKPTSTYLHRLIIRGQWAIGTLNCPIFLSHGKNLKYLTLSWCHFGEDSLGMLALHVPNLTYLKLNNMRTSETLVLSADSFPNLKTLILMHMPDVSELNIIDGALPCIEGLYIVSLSMLDTLPRGIGSLHSLKKLWLLDLHKDFIRHWYTSRMHQKVLHVPEVRI